MNISGVIGLLLSALLIGGAIGLGGAPDLFINLPSLIIVAGFVVGAGLMTYGTREFFGGIFSLRAFVVHSGAAYRRDHAAVLRGLIPSTYAAGLIAFLIGLLQLLATTDDPSTLVGSIAVALLGVFYAAVLSETILRPGARLIERRAIPTA